MGSRANHLAGLIKPPLHGEQLHGEQLHREPSFGETVAGRSREASSYPETSLHSVRPPRSPLPCACGAKRLKATPARQQGSIPISSSSTRMTQPQGSPPCSSPPSHGKTAGPTPHSRETSLSNKFSDHSIHFAACTLLATLRSSGSTSPSATALPPRLPSAK